MRLELHFVVQDETGARFNVTISRRDQTVTASCDCAEGKAGKLCDHRIRLLGGDTTQLVSGNEQDVNDLVNGLRGTDVGNAMAAYHNAQAALQAAHTTFARSRQRLERAMLF